MIHKIQKRNGETIAETLVALLIGALALLMMPLAIVTSAKINHTVAGKESYGTVEMKPNEMETSGVLDGAGVWIAAGDNPENKETVASDDVTVYKDPAGFIYYDYEK